MPSLTFLRLPEEKKEKLMRAVMEEFARVPFEKASINRIVQSAGIARGSFYMYFTDKEDALKTLLTGVHRGITAQVGDALRENGGDLFSVYLNFFDRVMAMKDKEDQRARLEREGRTESVEYCVAVLMAVFRVNTGFGASDVLKFQVSEEESQQALEAVASQIPAGRLRADSREELQALMEMLALMTGFAASKCFLGEEPVEKQRKNLLRMFDIARRGILNEITTKEET